MSKYIIEIKDKSFAISQYELKSFPIIIGRSSQCEIVISDESISRRHLAISISEGNDLLIEDLGSANGSKMNNKSMLLGHPEFFTSLFPINFGTGFSLRLIDSLDSHDFKNLKVVESKQNLSPHLTLETDTFVMPQSSIELKNSLNPENEVREVSGNETNNKISNRTIVLAIILVALLAWVILSPSPQ
mgnify:CR=1 FL=1